MTVVCSVPQLAHPHVCKSLWGRCGVCSLVLSWGNGAGSKVVDGVNKAVCVCVIWERDTHIFFSFDVCEKRSSGLQEAPFQYSCLENLMHQGAWHTLAHGAAGVRRDWSNWAHMCMWEWKWRWGLGESPMAWVDLWVLLVVGEKGCGEQWAERIQDWACDGMNFLEKKGNLQKKVISYLFAASITR